MNCIKYKINNHIVLNDEDIRKVIRKRLCELKYKNKNIVSFINDKKYVDYMAYTVMNNKVLIDKNYKSSTLEGIISDFLVKLKVNKNNNIFIKDAYNLEILSSLYHEIRHKEQYNLYFDEGGYYNYLLKVSLEYMDMNYDFYKNKHNQFLSEYDAEIKAYMLVLDSIEKEYTNISESSVYWLNANIAYFILSSRGYKLKGDKLERKNHFKSPLHLLTFLTKSWYENNSKYQKYYKYTINAIKEVRCNKTENEKLIIGDNLNEETINELYLIALGKIKTKNIFKYFENKLSKEKTKYLCKKIQN